MARTTPATRFLASRNIDFTLHGYEYAPGADRVGLQAAEALQEHPARVLKTLMILIDGRPGCAILPSDRTLSMKKVAVALGGRSAQLMAPADALRISGYHVGGISPFGQRRSVPVVLEAAAMREALVFINAGQRGLQLQIAPSDAVAALGAIVAAITA